MPDTKTMEKLGGLRAAFVEDERQVRLSTGRLACWLVILLMPLGTIADADERRAGRVVDRAVEHLVAGERRVPAEPVPVRAVHHVFVFQRGVAALQPADHVARGDGPDGVRHGEAGRGAGRHRVGRKGFHRHEVHAADAAPAASARR